CGHRPWRCWPRGVDPSGWSGNGSTPFASRSDAGAPRRRSMRIQRLALAVVAISFFAAACGGGASPKPSFTLPTAVGAGEGALSVLAWPGYAENGGTDPTVNWVKP